MIPTGGGKPTAAKSGSAPSPKQSPATGRAKLNSLLKQNNCALVAGVREALSILSNGHECTEPKYVVMPFQCRTLTDGDELYLVVHRDVQGFDPANGKCSQQDHVYKVIAKMKFVANRRVDLDKLFSMASSSRCGLPVNDRELGNVKHDLQMTKSNKTYILWEMQLIKGFGSSPVCVQKATTVLETSTSSTGGFKPVRPRSKDSVTV